jgi:hypothetical protein
VVCKLRGNAQLRAHELVERVWRTTRQDAGRRVQLERGACKLVIQICGATRGSPGKRGIYGRSDCSTRTFRKLPRSEHLKGWLWQRGDERLRPRSAAAMVVVVVVVVIVVVVVVVVFRRGGGAWC